MELTLSLIKMIVGLVLVVFLINLFLKYLQKFVAPQDSKFRVIKKIAVSKTSSIGIVQVVDRYYLMSLAEQSSSVIAELSQDEVDQLFQSSNQQNVDKKNFASLLKEKTAILKDKGKK